MNAEQQLGTEKIGKLLVKFSVPCIISLVLNAVYNMVDQVFIGQGVGYLGNGATNVIFPLVQIATAIGLLLGEGGANLISLHLGAGEKEKASKTMAAAYSSLWVVGVVIAALYLIFLEPLCWMFGATDLTIDYALGYGRIISFGMIFNVFAIGSMSLVRADGKPGIAMLGMVCGCAVNLIGDPIAIFVLDMGVEGAAWATILGQLVNAVINLWALSRCKSVDFNRNSYKGCLRYTPSVAKGGLSSFMTQFALVILMAVQNNLCVYYGGLSKYGPEIPMSALGVTMKFFVVVQCAVLGLATGGQPIFGYNYGRRQYQRVKDTYKLILSIAIVLLLLATLWFQLAPMSIVNLFGSDDPLYTEFAVKCLRIFLMLIVIEAFQTTGTIFLQALGKPVRAACLTLIRQIIISVPCTWLMGRLMGVEGILWAGPISMVLTAIIAVIMLAKQWRELSEQPRPIP